jgi:hypothetical protein
MLFTQITRRHLKLHHCVAMTINHSVNSTTDLFIVTVRWSCRVDIGIRDSAVERYYKRCEVVYKRGIASTLTELQTCVTASGDISLRRKLCAVRVLIIHSKTVVYIRVYNACFDVKKPVFYPHIVFVYFLRY